MTALTEEEIEAMRNPSELPHHWNLRREFIKTHQEKYPMDRLICLSHVYVNTECLGLSYPAEVASLVKELGKAVDKNVYEINRTFVPEKEAPNLSQPFHSERPHHHHQQQMRPNRPPQSQYNNNSNHNQQLQQNFHQSSNRSQRAPRHPHPNQQVFRLEPYRPPPQRSQPQQHQSRPNFFQSRGGPSFNQNPASDNREYGRPFAYANRRGGGGGAAGGGSGPRRGGRF